ncbi:hypothetical protein AB1A64_15365 [Ruegeria sp. ANG10]|uniref:hypothetical protein n=1 Tax=Ruegeria sp. ANG10 TaxID=3042467 RepID=UPI003453299E
MPNPQPAETIKLHPDALDRLSKVSTATVATLLYKRGYQNAYPVPESQSPWHQYFRDLVQPFDKGMNLRNADAYRDIARKSLPRDNH